MFNKNLFKAKLIEKGIPVLKICNETGICQATFYRKITRDGDFSRFEIEKIAMVLELSIEEVNNIFFALKLA